MRDAQRQTRVAVSQFLDGIAPWLIELGNWIFGGLIGFNVVILGAVLAIVPVDNAVKVATAASALAIPPSAVGLVVLRLVADVRSIRESQHAETPESEHQAVARRRNTIVRRYAYVLMTVSTILALVAVTAALSHVALWIAVAFLVAVGASVTTVIVAVTQLAAEAKPS